MLREDRGPEPSLPGPRADRVLATDAVFAQIGGRSGARTQRSAGRWEPLEDDLSLLADRPSDQSRSVAAELFDAVLQNRGKGMEGRGMK